MSHEEVLWSWLDGLSRTTESLETDGERLVCRRVPIAWKTKQWKEVVIVKSDPDPDVQKMVSRVRQLCHTLGFTNVGETKVGKSRKEETWLDQ